MLSSFAVEVGFIRWTKISLVMRIQDCLVDLKSTTDDFSVKIKKAALPATRSATEPSSRSTWLRRTRLLRRWPRSPWLGSWPRRRHRGTRRCSASARPSRCCAPARSADEARPRTCPGWRAPRGRARVAAGFRCRTGSSSFGRRWPWNTDWRSFYWRTKLSMDVAGLEVSTVGSYLWSQRSRVRTHLPQNFLSVNLPLGGSTLGKKVLNKIMEWESSFSCTAWADLNICGNKKTGNSCL